jgi:hypothetical protein
VESIEIAIGHVAEWYIVKGEAELVLIEAANRDAESPFVCAVGVGAGDFDAGQMGEDGDGTCAGGGLEQELLVDGLDVAGFTLGGDGDFVGNGDGLGLLRILLLICGLLRVGNGRGYGLRTLGLGGCGEAGDKSAGKYNATNGRVVHYFLLVDRGPGIPVVSWVQICERPKWASG